MSELDSYVVVPLKLSPDAKNCHNVYMREHFIRIVDIEKPKGRTLFLLNVPPYVMEKHLQQFFARIGGIESVTFAENAGRNETEKWTSYKAPFSSKRAPYCFKVAYIVFQNSKCVQKALKLKNIELFCNETGETWVETGMQLWHNEQKQMFLDEALAQSQVDEYMKVYDECEKERREAEKTTAPDADGWVTVGKQGRNAGFEQKEPTVQKLKTKLARSEKELKHFYTFQIRDSKMKEIINLREKFEEDKKKIELIKKTRRFKPF